MRKYLHEIGYQIIDEDFVKDDEKYYTVIVAVPGKECYTNEYEYLYGKQLIAKQLPVFKEWLIKKEEKIKDIYGALNDNPSESALRRRAELEAELKMHQEVMACLDWENS